MSRKSRRKTLSHADLEDFLCDLGDGSENISESMDVVDTKVGNIPTANNDHFKERRLMSDEQQVREFCKVSRYKENA